MPLEPKRLSAATGFSFVQLAVPAERKREDAAMIAWFRRNHPKIAAFVINADPTMCDRDPALPLTAPFPFWLYGSDLGYLSHLMSASMLRYGIRRIKVTLGRSTTSDPSGATFEEVKFAFAAPPPAVQPPFTDLSPDLLGDTGFPAMDLMEGHSRGSSSTLVIFVNRPRISRSCPRRARRSGARSRPANTSSSAGSPRIRIGAASTISWIRKRRATPRISSTPVITGRFYEKNRNGYRQRAAGHELDRG